MRTSIWAPLLFAATLASATASPEAPHVSLLRLSKSTHQLRLYDGDAVVATYHASIGPGGLGVKKQEGDDVTPVGRYHIVSRKDSQYRIFLRLDYPNADDRARFAALKAAGELPADAHIGGDIGIHGTPQAHKYDAIRATFPLVDWTAGCIAVTDDEIDHIAALVADGTEIEIQD